MKTKPNDYQQLEKLRSDLQFAEQVVDKALDLCFDSPEGNDFYLAANRYYDAVFNKLNEVEKGIYQTTLLSKYGI